MRGQPSFWQAVNQQLNWLTTTVLPIGEQTLHWCRGILPFIDGSESFCFILLFLLFEALVYE
jgi:hypothetical protein